MALRSGKRFLILFDLTGTGVNITMFIESPIPRDSSVQFLLDCDNLNDIAGSVDLTLMSGWYLECFSLLSFDNGSSIQEMSSFNLIFIFGNYSGNN